MVNKMSNMLKAHGVRRGDRVAIYLPQSPVAVSAMLACARIGAIHSVVFAGFSSEALADRIIDGRLIKIMERYRKNILASNGLFTFCYSQTSQVILNIYQARYLL